MANRNFYMESFSAEPATVKLYAKITFATAAGVDSGDPVLTRAKGVASITRTSAGLFVLTLSETYQRVLAFNGTWLASSGIPGAPGLALKTDASASTKALTFTSGAYSGGSGAYVVTKPADGDVLLLEITLSNSSAI